MKYKRNQDSTFREIERFLQPQARWIHYAL